MREFSIIKERILQYLDSKSITKYECYQRTGITNGVFSQKNGMSEDNLLRFLSYYVDINIEWLITGKGEMLKGSVINSVAEQQAEYEPQTSIYIDKYIKQIEEENNRLCDECKRKQEIIDGFLTGSIIKK